jgi:hypothetical protein
MSVETTERALATVRRLIEAQPDVKRVVHLAPDGLRFRYMIETPFETFPRFVIGTTDAGLTDVRIIVKCGTEWGAEDLWGKA